MDLASSIWSTCKELFQDLGLPMKLQAHEAMEADWSLCLQSWRGKRSWEPHARDKERAGRALGACLADALLMSTLNSVDFLTSRGQSLKKQDICGSGR